MPRYQYTKLPVLRNRKGFYYICEICKNEFYVPASRVRQAEKTGHPIRFCSIKCRGIGYRGEGNPMWGKKLSPEAKAKMMAHPNRRRFDPGKDNPNYKKHGITPHKESSNCRWRRTLRKERGARCEHCGYSEYPDILELHHIDCNRKNNIRENLELLCPNCHMVVHYLNKTGRYRNKKKRTTI